MIWEKPWFQYSLLLFMAFIWGSSFILMKIGLKSFSSNDAAAIRIASASLVLLPFAVKSFRNLKSKDIYYLLITGFIGSFIPAFLFTKAQTRIDSSLAGMLNSLTPVFTLVIGVVIFRVKTWWIQLAGLAMGLAGAMGLIASGDTLSFRGINSYAFLIIMATLCYGINVNVVKAKLTHLKGIQISSLSFLFIGPFAGAYLLFSDFSSLTSNENWPVHLGALIILGVIGTGIALLLMYSLIRYTTGVFAASVTYIIPLFAILWGVLDGETISLFHLFSMLILLLGIYLINRK